MAIPMQYEDAVFNKMAPDTKRQMPLYSNVGRGLRGDPSYLTIDASQNPPNIVGYHVDLLRGEPDVDFTLPMMNLVPNLHYRMYSGVREIDGVNMNGYYIRYYCDVEINGEMWTFWCFDTPFTPTTPFNGSVIPEDQLIDQDNTAPQKDVPISKQEYIDAVNPYVLEIEVGDISSGPMALTQATNKFTDIDQFVIASIGRKIDNEIYYSNPYGLLYESISVRNTTIGGNPYVSINMSLNNQTGHAITIDAYRITMLPFDVIH